MKADNSIGEQMRRMRLLVGLLDDAGNRGVTVAACARHLDVSKATAARYLATLAEHGAAHDVPDGEQRRRWVRVTAVVRSSWLVGGAQVVRL